MIKKRIDHTIEWLEFDLLQEFPGVCHATFLRGENFNLGEKKGTRQEKFVLDILNLKKGVKLKQCHEVEIIEVKEVQRGWTLYENYDGMITREKGVGLMIRHADCQAAIFFDPKSAAIANVHCGWRGSVKNIYRKTILKMAYLYGTNPQELRVCISPSLGPEKAEFLSYKKDLPSSFWKFQRTPTYFDFWAISRQQLCDEGILEKNIEIAQICTYSNPKDCFSYRREQQTGYHGTIVALNL